jgi:4a-hydroxytetrahydrobiopterin dehydratase
MTPRPTRLTDDELAAALEDLPDWSVVDGRLHRTFEFSDFTAAFGFMTAVAAIAEELDHHPDWSNLWNTVRINIESHDAGGLTALCFEMATRINATLG